jgi:hypothetical protein
MVFNALIPAAFHHFLVIAIHLRSICAFLHRHFIKLSDNLQGTTPDAKPDKKGHPPQYVTDAPVANMRSGKNVLNHIIRK